MTHDGEGAGQMFKGERPHTDQNAKVFMTTISEVNKRRCTWIFDRDTGIKLLETITLTFEATCVRDLRSNFPQLACQAKSFRGRFTDNLGPTDRIILKFSSCSFGQHASTFHTMEQDVFQSSTRKQPSSWTHRRFIYNVLSRSVYTFAFPPRDEEFTC